MQADKTGGTNRYPIHGWLPVALPGRAAVAAVCLTILLFATIELPDEACVSCAFLSKEGHGRPGGGTGSKVVKQRLREGWIG